MRDNLAPLGFLQVDRFGCCGRVFSGATSVRRRSQQFGTEKSLRDLTYGPAAKSGERTPLAILLL